MSRRVWLASACVVGGLVLHVAGGGPASAEDPSGGPTPTQSAVTSPPPTLPVPSPSATPAAPVSRLTAHLDGTGAVIASWQPGDGDTGFLAEAVAGGRTRRVETGAPTASFSELPSGALVRITVTAHGRGGNAPPVSTTLAVPVAVAGVTGASMRPVPAGILVSWRPPTAALPGTRYLVELTGTDGSRRSRLVPGSSVIIAGLTRGRLYSATVTAVTDGGRSAPMDVDGVVWLPPAVAGPGALPEAARPSSRLPSHAASAMATSAAVQPAAERTLVSSPFAAAGLAALAVILGGLAIGLLLRRPAGS